MALQKLPTPTISHRFSGIYKLPLEISDAIMSLIDDNPRALAACSLTCQALVALAQSRLFRHLRLKQLEKSGDFIDLLDKNPRLGTYVRSLCIWGSNRIVGGDDLHVIIARLSARLTAVQTLQVDCHKDQDLAARIATAFPNLRVLELDFFFIEKWETALEAILLANPGLEEWALGRITWRTLPIQRTLPDSSVMGSAYLRHVHCCNSVLILIAWLISRRALLRVHSLHVVFSSSFVSGKDDLKNILMGLGSHLKSLRLQAVSWKRARDDFSLASNTGLRKLELGTFVLRRYLDVPRSDVDDIGAILSTASPALEEYIVWLWCMDVVDLETVNWSRLNRIVHGAPSLCSITFWLPSQMTGSIDVARKRIGDWLLGQRDNILISVEQYYIPLPMSWSLLAKS